MPKERTNVKMKQCSYCRKMKSTADGFHKKTKSPDGLQTRCKTCNVKARTTGVGPFTFKENNVSSAIGQPLSELIPDSVLQLNEAESEDLQLTGRVISWTV